MFHFMINTSDSAKYDIHSGNNKESHSASEEEDTESAKLLDSSIDHVYVPLSVSCCLDELSLMLRLKLVYHL